MTERLHFHFSLSCIGEGNGNPLQCSCLENPRDGGAWWAAIYGVAQSRTRLNRLSNSSSRSNLASGSNHEDWRSVLQVDYIPHIFPSTDLKQLVHYFYRNIFNKSQVYSYNMLMIKFFARAPAYEKFQMPSLKQVGKCFVLFFFSQTILTQRALEEKF